MWRRAAQDVFLAALVVAQHAPAGAGELQGDDRDQQHPDEGMDRQQRPDLEDGRSLDREQDDQERRDGKRELLVARAAAG